MIGPLWKKYPPMPELPEVQTTVNSVARAIKEQVITAAWMDPRKPVNTGSNLAWTGIRSKITGRKIKSVTRRAKFIVIHLDNGSSLWIHQKMTGHLLRGRWGHRKEIWTSRIAGPLADDPMNRYIRLLFTFKNGKQLALSDARRFARIILVRLNEKLSEIKELARLGPEPLELKLSEFEALLKARRGRIKPTLTDPTVIVGIGNIYADEILYRAGVYPFDLIPRLEKRQVQKMYRAMRSILAAAIRAGGSSTDDYRTPDGNRGRYQNYHRAYQRTGQVCGICHRAKIKRIVRNGRSSHFCSAHQVAHD